MVGPSGTVAGRAGAITSAADSLQIRLFGRGAHGSMPQASIDPVVMAAATVMRLQTIVSREIAAAEAAVVTIGVLQAGTKENVIPDEAIIKLNVRTFDAGVRTRVLAAIERIVNAEAAASGAPRKPEITTLDHYPLNVNDRDASKRVVDAFRGHFGTERVRETGPAPASEDFGSFGTEWHVASVFWFVGGTDPESTQRRKRQSAQRASGEPQPEIRTRSSSHVANRCGNAGRRDPRLAIAVAWSRYARGPPSREEPDRSNCSPRRCDCRVWAEGRSMELLPDFLDLAGALVSRSVERWLASSAS